MPVEYQVNIFPITDLSTALSAIRLITEEGEGSGAPPDYQSHFVRDDNMAFVVNPFELAVRKDSLSFEAKDWLDPSDPERKIWQIERLPQKSIMKMRLFMAWIRASSVASLLPFCCSSSSSAIRCRRNFTRSEK